MNNCQAVRRKQMSLLWSERAFADFKHHVRRLTGRSWVVYMAYRLGKLAQYVRGWMGYINISDYAIEL